MNEESPHLAVIGMAGRFPGAPDLAGFWANLAAGAESAERTPAGGDRFDAGFFGYAPSEAQLLDPQHRVFLEVAWEALEHAGCDPTRFDGAIGVYGGSGDTGYSEVLRQHRHRFPNTSELQFRMAGGVDFLTSRVSYKFGLTGPAVTVQTACSTSLVAIHTAAQALLAGECDLALAGGITLHVPFPVEEPESGIIAPDGHCRAFDASAQGTVASDGAGVVALKRLDDALADRDRIHAVILASAVNNDGAGKVGFTAPSVDGQAAAVRAALELADVDPATIGYVEAHGTGTPVGDPIEVRALAKAFAVDETGFCLLGSVKTNIGHTDAAAGVIGFIKAVLALDHELVPGTVHFRSPNPMLELSSTPFRVSADAVAWPRSAQPRRAGVNSLGIGGTNAHVVLEEAPARDRTPEVGHQLLPVSARSADAVAQAGARLAAHVSGESLPEVAWTLQTGRKSFSHRGFVVAEDAADAAEQLRRLGSKPVPERVPGVAFLFPGQGGQHVGMGRELYRREAVFRAEFDRCADLVLPGIDLRDVVFRGDAERLATMSVGQPAVFAVEYALAKLWMSWGVRPAAVVGHSLGAYAAAAIAGVLSVEDALSLVVERGRLMDSIPTGGMLAVPLPEAEVLPLLGGLSLAAVNGPAQCVVAGPLSEVDDLRVRLAGAGVDGRLLRISTAAHSTLVEPVLSGFEKKVAGVTPHPPVIPWMSDRTGRFVTADEATDPAFWSAHFRETVRFADALAALPADLALVEVGPGRTLSGLARQQSTPERVVVASMPHPAEDVPGPAVLLHAVGALWQAGVEVDWAALHPEQPYKTALPTYPFERKLFRLDADEEPEVETEAAQVVLSETERVLAAAFGAILGLRHVDADDNFVALGGDSMLATRVVGMVRADLGVELGVRDLFRAPTVAGLAKLIEDRR
ncbi:type I polyketide synthase [Saccharothrix variisporea]|uniref:Acyl transferase domain-containing protein n=1 Tax=Saccharothrix variisporea TaxID=543527 RepID=A0A495X103_9PSEU|nr:type I polyketide synthase [Saccharothrix variisporea]RKT67517.1 acyl transferase domain-containing protein [Saccharothrix variisporea]